MPCINYFLSTQIELSKDALIWGLPRELTPKLDLGKDNRQWNKKQLQALTLILCNVVMHHREDDGIFFYSREKGKNLHTQFNPNNVGHSSILWVLDKLIDAEVLYGIRGIKRTAGNNPKQTSEFHVTQTALEFAYSLGINRKTIKVIDAFHVRLRDHKRRDNLLPFEQSDYTALLEMRMAQYCHYLNQQSIMLKTSDEEGEGIVEYGTKLGGTKIHLHRNFKDWSNNDAVKTEFDKLFMDTNEPNFLFGGRSGGYWMSSEEGKRENRPTILINGNKTGKADFPCSHLNILYKHETNQWFQTLTRKELEEENRIKEDGYKVNLPVPRPFIKHMVQLMLNIKGRASVSREFNAWVYRKNYKWIPVKPKPKSILARHKKKVIDEANVAHPTNMKLWKTLVKQGLTPLILMEAIEEKHEPIKDYFYKGKLAGQIIQWVEANLIHNIAVDFMKQDIPCLTVYDELIVEKEHLPMVKEFMYSSGHCDICNEHSLLSQIKDL